MTVVAEQPTRTQKIMRRLSQPANVGVQSHLTCRSCKAAFPDMPGTYVQPDTLIWCTNLGTESKYHVVFVSHSDVSIRSSRPNHIRATAVHVSLSRLQPNKERLLILRPDENISAQFNDSTIERLDPDNTLYCTIYICPRLLLCLILLSTGYRDQLARSSNVNNLPQKNQATLRKLEKWSDTHWLEYIPRLMMKSIYRRPPSSISPNEGLLCEN